MFRMVVAFACRLCVRGISATGCCVQLKSTLALLTSKKLTGTVS